MLTYLLLTFCTYDKIDLPLPADDDCDCDDRDECDDARDTDAGLGLLDCLVLADVLASVAWMRTFRTGVLATFDGVLTGTGGGLGGTGSTVVGSDLAPKPGRGGTPTLAPGTICFMSCDIMLNMSPQSVLSSLQDRHHTCTIHTYNVNLQCISYCGL